MEAFVRIELTKPQMRGVTMSVMAELSGVGLLAKSGSMDELFNLTVDRIMALCLQTYSEFKVTGRGGTVK
jgi:hypothetical protein